MFDPVEGIYYNTITEKPEDEEILKRLISSTEENSHGAIKKRIKIFKDFVQHLDNEFPKSIVRINAENTALQVFKTIQEVLEG